MARFAAWRTAVSVVTDHRNAALTGIVIEALKWPGNGAKDATAAARFATQMFEFNVDWRAWLSRE
jgi:hypothetical protein